MKKLILLLSLLTAFSAAYAKDVMVCTVDGIISGYTHKYIEASLKEAGKRDAALMIKLNTPGGVLDSTRDIVQLILETKTPVIVFVSPQGARAGSAGTFITLSAAYAVMAEGSNIGAAHPVDITGKDIQGEMAVKIENDTAAFIRSIAEKRHRNAEAAIATVKGSASYTAQEALTNGLIDAVADTDAQAASLAGQKLGFKAGTITEIKPTELQKLAFFLADPNILIILLFIGIASIILEFKMPGTFIFAATGVVALVVFMMGINIIPINAIGLLLVFTGICLLVAEVFIPSFGLLSLGAVMCLGFGMFFMFSREGNMGIGISIWTIIAVIAVIASGVILLGRLILKDFRKKPVTGQTGLTGEIGTIQDWNNGEGHIYVHGEIWKAKSTTSFNINDRAKVTSVKGLILTIEEADNDE